MRVGDAQRERWARRGRRQLGGPGVGLEVGVRGAGLGGEGGAQAVSEVGGRRRQLELAEGGVDLDPGGAARLPKRTSRRFNASARSEPLWGRSRLVRRMPRSLREICPCAFSSSAVETFSHATGRGGAGMERASPAWVVQKCGQGWPRLREERGAATFAGGASDVLVPYPRRPAVVASGLVDDQRTFEWGGWAGVRSERGRGELARAHVSNLTLPADGAAPARTAGAGQPHTHLLCRRRSPRPLSDRKPGDHPPPDDALPSASPPPRLVLRRQTTRLQRRSEEHRPHGGHHPRVAAAALQSEP